MGHIHQSLPPRFKYHPERGEERMEELEGREECCEMPSDGHGMVTAPRNSMQL